MDGKVGCFVLGRRELEMLDMLQANKVAGILLCSRMGDTGIYADYELPLISIDREIKGIPSVTADNHSGGTQAAQALINAGCRHPLLFGIDVPDYMMMSLRYRGFRDACAGAAVRADTHERAVFKVNALNRCARVGREVKPCAVNAEIAEGSTHRRFIGSRRLYVIGVEFTDRRAVSAVVARVVAAGAVVGLRLQNPSGAVNNAVFVIHLFDRVRAALRVRFKTEHLI